MSIEYLQGQGCAEQWVQGTFTGPVMANVGVAADQNIASEIGDHTEATAADNPDKIKCQLDILSTDYFEI